MHAASGVRTGPGPESPAESSARGLGVDRHRAPDALNTSEGAVGKVLIWDAPIRVFHVLFAVCCTAALILAVAGEDSPAVFGLHMVCGIAAVFLLVVRVAIGVFGGRHNRLSSMVFGPRATLAYCMGVFTGRAPRYPVHNPGTSGAALLMFVVVPVLMWTGLDPEREGADELHALLAYGLLGLLGAHLMGLAVHTCRHRENIAAAMMTGRKSGPAALGLPSARPVQGAAVLVASLLWIGALFASYSHSTGTVELPIVGYTLHLQSSAADRQNLPEGD